MRRLFILFIALCTVLSMFAGCSKEITASETEVYHTGNAPEVEAIWSYGYGASSIIAPSHTDGKGLYIAGYHNGRYGNGYLNRNMLETYQKMDGRPTGADPDYSQARAAWVDAGAGGLLLIGIDCVGLSKTVTDQIREQLFPLCSENNCVSVNVYATHSHASADTLGLWGPLAVDGKNDEYMHALVDAAVEAAKAAMENRHTGQLRFGYATTQGILHDSRDPQVYDPNLYQLRFENADGEKGLRLLFYGAHAESMRGDNTLLSRDFPGVMCDVVTYKTGDHAMFLPGAIGGLLYTNILTEGDFKAAKNMELTGNALAEYALSIKPSDETVIPPELSVARKLFTAKMDNTLYLYLKFLGVLTNEVMEGNSDSGYLICSEMSVLRLGELHIVCIPGEIFPELVFGGEYHYYGTDGENPVPLQEIAAGYGVENMLIIGLCNDMLGYIVPPSDFLVSEAAPYLEGIEDPTGENHYEETNSLGPDTAHTIAETFEALLAALEA